MINISVADALRNQDGQQQQEEEIINEDEIEMREIILEVEEEEIKNSRLQMIQNDEPKILEIVCTPEFESPSSEICCRYCYENIDETRPNSSCCLCRTAMCKSCFMREIKMTALRGDGDIKCTVCQHKYRIKTFSTCGDYRKKFKLILWELNVFEYQDGTQMGSTVGRIITLMTFIMSMFPILIFAIYCLAALRFDISKAAGVFGIIDIFINWGIQRTMNCIKETNQPGISFWFLLIHSVRSIVYCNIYVPGIDGLIMFFLSQFMIFFFFMDLVLTLKERLHADLRRIVHVIIENNEAISMSDIISA